MKYLVDLMTPLYADWLLALEISETGKRVRETWVRLLAVSPEFRSDTPEEMWATGWTIIEAPDALAWMVTTEEMGETVIEAKAWKIGSWIVRVGWNLKAKVVVMFGKPYWRGEEA